jgi:NAD-dependent deacetylase
MIPTILAGEDESLLAEALERFQGAKKAAALTGAGISVESGIPDFRSPGGLWTVFAPGEYAGIDVFLNDPEKGWELYRALGRTLEGKAPNPAHEALARLEAAGRLRGVVTQNVDGLHQAAGSERVIEMHGDHQHLKCLQCGGLEPVDEAILHTEVVPRCRRCDYPLKPNVVLFGEAVRGMEEIDGLLEGCDLLLVIGTSAQVYPAAGLPARVKEQGGLLYEFNVEPTALTRGETGGGPYGGLFASSRAAVRTDYLFMGRASETVPLLLR